MTVHFFNNLLAFLPQLDLNATTDTSPMTNNDAISSIMFGSILLLIGLSFFIRFIINNKKYLKSGFSPKLSQDNIYLN